MWVEIDRYSVGVLPCAERHRTSEIRELLFDAEYYRWIDYPRWMFVFTVWLIKTHKRKLNVRNRLDPNIRPTKFTDEFFSWNWAVYLDSCKRILGNFALVNFWRNLESWEFSILYHIVGNSCELLQLSVSNILPGFLDSFNAMPVIIKDKTFYYAYRYHVLCLRVFLVLCLSVLYIFYTPVTVWDAINLLC